MGGILDVAGIGSIADLLKDGMDKIWPDPAARAAAELQIRTLDNQLAQGQMAINQVEAANNNLFVSGWRPFIGWACGVIFVYHFMILPMIYVALAMWWPGMMYDATGAIKLKLPAFDVGVVKDTIDGLLGIYGTQRTVEKLAEKGHLPWQKKDSDN